MMGGIDVEYLMPSPCRRNFVAEALKRGARLSTSAEDIMCIDLVASRGHTVEESMIDDLIYYILILPGGSSGLESESPPPRGEGCKL